MWQSNRNTKLNGDVIKVRKTISIFVILFLISIIGVVGMDDKEVDCGDPFWIFTPDCKESHIQPVVDDIVDEHNEDIEDLEHADRHIRRTIRRNEQQSENADLFWHKLSMRKDQMWFNQSITYADEHDSIGGGWSRNSVINYLGTTFIEMLGSIFATQTDNEACMLYGDQNKALIYYGTDMDSWDLELRTALITSERRGEPVEVINGLNETFRCDYTYLDCIHLS